MAKKHHSINFEKTLAELEALVEKMEAGELPLEQSLQHFERGIALAGSCREALAKAEQKVQILLEKEGKAALEPFDPAA